MGISYVDVLNDVIYLQIIYMRICKLEKHANATDITNLIGITLTNVQRIRYIFDWLAE